MAKCKIISKLFFLYSILLFQCAIIIRDTCGQKILNSETFSKKFQDVHCEPKRSQETSNYYRGYKSEGEELQDEDQSNLSYIGTFGRGRLGNQIAALATLFGLHKKFGLKIFMAPYQLDFLRTYLKSDFLDRIEPQIVDYQKHIWIRPFREYDFTNNTLWYKNKYGKKYIDLGKYPNAIYIYKFYIKELKNILKIKEEYTQEAHRRLSKIRSEHLKKVGRNVEEESITFISIHVRRTDYIKHLEIAYEMDWVDDSYFSKAIRYYKNKFENILFYVVSDDLPWCREHLLGLDENIYIVGNQKPEEKSKNNWSKLDQTAIDLALLTFANHSLLTHGTYGIWGALVSGGEAVWPMSHNNLREAKDIREAEIYGWRFI